MLLYNKDLQALSINSLKKELLADLDSISTPTRAEIEDDLGQYYSEAFALDTKQYSAQFIGQSFSIGGVGAIILGKIKQFVCSILNAASTADEIIDAILKALSSIIPGGIIIQFIAKKLVKFIIDSGIGVFCAV